MDSSLPQKPLFTRSLLYILAVIFAFGSVSGAIYLVTRNNTLGSDFFIYYVASRQITMGSGSPYDETVGEQSQMAVLKHPAREGEDQLRYVYPPYGLIPMLPLSGLPFSAAQAIWMTASIFGIPLSLICGFRKVSPWFLISIFFLYPLTFGLLLGNMNMPVMCILILLAGRIPELTKKNRKESILLGLLISWATIKPQFSAFFILVFLLVGFRNRNYAFLFSFVAGLLGLLAFSFLLIPDWLIRWTALLQRYPGYIGGKIPLTPLIELLPVNWHIAAYTFLAMIALTLSIWFVYRWWKEKTSFWHLMAVGGFVTYAFHPTGLSYDQMIFLLPFIFWILKDWGVRPISTSIIWCCMVTCSWLMLYLSLSHIWDGATYYGMYFFYILWMVVFLRFGFRSNQSLENS